MDQDQEVPMNSGSLTTTIQQNSLLEPDVVIMEGESSPNTDETSDTLSKDSLIEENTSSTRKGGSYRETLPFTTSEMTCLKKGIKKFGTKSWLKILNYKYYFFNPLRTSESLKSRAIALNLVKTDVKTK